MKSFLLIFFLTSLCFANSSLQNALILINSKKNINQAYKILNDLSKKGNIKAQYNLAKLYLYPKTKYFNQTKAYNIFVKLANNNHSKSQIVIGRFFLQGKIVKKDYQKAMYYFKLASKQKEYNANCYIAYMYANGLGVYPNFGRANIFAKDEYIRGNKLCIKLWKRFNLEKYPVDNGFKIGHYLKPIK